MAGVQTGDRPSPITMAWTSDSALQEFFNFLLLNNSAFVRAGGHHPPPCAFLISSIHSTGIVSFQRMLSDKVHTVYASQQMTPLESERWKTPVFVADLLSHELSV